MLMPGPWELAIIGLVCLVPLAGVVVLIVVLYRDLSSSDSNPNLEPCPDCGRSASIHATSCPHCGCPFE